MRIGIYTDVHCSYTSSILPTHQEGSKYTTRLQMIVDTFRWMYEVFENNQVDLIVNCGDLFDSFNVRAEEISAMSEALSYGGKIPELHILGNHEILDKHRKFNAVALLDNYSHIDVISDPVKLKCGISLLPYCTVEEATDVIPYLTNNVLFSHIDIRGSYVTSQYLLEEGVEPTRLANNFKRVINGHLHSPQVFGGTVFNIGASTSLSFSDNSEYTPRISILDTNSLKLQFFSNPYAIRFLKVDVSSSEFLKSMLSELNNRVVIRAKSPIENKVEVSEVLQSCEKVVAYRIVTEHVSEESEEQLQDTVIESVTDVDGKFVEFLKKTDELKYPLSEYLNVVQDVFGGGGNM